MVFLAGTAGAVRPYSVRLLAFIASIVARTLPAFGCPTVYDPLLEVIVPVSILLPEEIPGENPVCWPAMART